MSEAYQAFVRAARRSGGLGAGRPVLKFLAMATEGDSRGDCNMVISVNCSGNAKVESRGSRCDYRITPRPHII